jgi:hypothetical protein
MHLSEQEQEAVTRLTRRHRSEQHVALRARMILAAAQGASNVHSVHELGINVETVRMFRDRWAKWQEVDHEKMDQGAVSVAQRLQDAPRPGAVPTCTVEQRAHMAALACEAPAKTGRPLKKSDGPRNRR